MEIPNVVGQQFAFLLPVGLVIVCAVLVFAFGIKSSVEAPSFKQLRFSSEDKKSLKKKKVKDKKSQSNGHATVLADDSYSKKEQPIKALKQSNKNESAKTKKSEENAKGKKQDNQKSPSKQDKKPVKKTGKENIPEGKTKKGSGSGREDKPSDFDEGKWETATSRKDKKNKKKDEDVAHVEKTPEKKVNKKKEQDKKQENNAQSPKKSKSPNSKGQKNVPEKQIEVVLTPVAKGQTQDNQGGKKKSKKSSAIDKGDENVPVNKEASSGGGKQSVKNSPPTKKPATQKAAKQSEPLKDKKNVQEPTSGAASDDSWKEAPQKKSKKKVRKD